MTARRGGAMASGLALAALLGFAGTRQAFGGAADEVTLDTAGSTVVRGEIKKESLARVVMVDDHNKPMPDFRGDQIREIVWDIPGDEWRRGMVELKANNYEAAAVFFKALADDIGSFREAARPCLLLTYATCLYRAGKAVEAEAELENLLKNHPESRYVPEAMDRMVEIEVQTKNTNKAQALLKRLSALGPKYALRALLYEADMDLAMGRADEASRKFTRAAAEATDAETQGLLRLGQARCAVVRQQYDAARQMAAEALKAKVTPAVAAMAHLITGTALLEQAKAAKDNVSMYMDAVLEFMRVTTLYAGDERTEPEALYRAGDSLRMLSRLPGRKPDSVRAAELFRAVRDKYPGSRWAKLATDALKQIR